MLWVGRAAELAATGARLAALAVATDRAAEDQAAQEAAAQELQSLFQARAVWTSYGCRRLLIRRRHSFQHVGSLCMLAPLTRR